MKQIYIFFIFFILCVGFMNGEDSAQNTQDSKTEIIESKIDSTESKQLPKLKWFIGGYIGSQLKDNNSGQNSIEASLDGGFIYYVGLNHGLRAYASVIYANISSFEMWLAALSVDYLYAFNGKFYIFGGGSLNAPLHSSIKSINAALYGGVGLYIAKNHHIDIRIGYPIAQDSKLPKALTFGIAYRYIFGK